MKLALITNQLFKISDLYHENEALDKNLQIINKYKASLCGQVPFSYVNKFNFLLFTKNNLNS